MALRAAEDPREIVLRSVKVERANEALARSYTFIERQDMREFDGHNAVKRHEIKTFDVTLCEGSPYRRLIARGDRPLSAEDTRVEQEKLDRNIAERQRETPEQRAKRLADWDKRRKKEREFLQEVPEAFNFRLLGDKRANGRDVWVIEGLPREGYRPHSLATRFLTKTRATLWIDKATYGWVRAEAETLDTVTVGGIILRVHKGTRFLVEQTHVNGEVWMPAHIHLSGSGRIALVKRIAADLDITYRDFRKFSADSRVVSFGFGPGQGNGAEAGEGQSADGPK